MMKTSALPSGVLRRGLLAGAAVTATLVLSACGGDSTSSGSGMDHGGRNATGGAPASAATFVDADVTFAQSMVEHHRQAIQMAAMADGRAADAEVKALATKIRGAQQPEIDTMNGWLTAWGGPAPMPSMSMPSDMPGMGHGSMPGMMSEQDMTRLMDAEAAAFDRQFLTMMIAHHEGAVAMARQEAAQGANPDAKALAQKIVTDQQAEIAMMKKILDRL